MTKKFVIGDRVVHCDYGKGVIQKIKSGGRINVFFEDSVLREVLSDNLSKLDERELDHVGLCSHSMYYDCSGMSIKSSSDLAGGMRSGWKLSDFYKIHSTGPISSLHIGKIIKCSGESASTFVIGDMVDSLYGIGVVVKVITLDSGTQYYNVYYPDGVIRGLFTDVLKGIDRQDEKKVRDITWDNASPEEIFDMVEKAKLSSLGVSKKVDEELLRACEDL